MHERLQTDPAPALRNTALPCFCCLPLPPLLPCAAAAGGAEGKEDAVMQAFTHFSSTFLGPRLAYDAMVLDAQVGAAL